MKHNQDGCPLTLVLITRPVIAHVADDYVIKHLASSFADIDSQLLQKHLACAHLTGAAVAMNDNDGETFC